MQQPGRKLPSIRQQLQLEIAQRGVTASLAFASLGIGCFLYPFGRDQVDSFMRAAALLAVLLSLVRFAVSAKATRAGAVSAAQYRLLSATILLNSVAWGIYFVLAHGEALYDGENFLHSFLLLVGFCIASLISLSASPYLSQIFVLCNLGGQILLFGYAEFFTDRPVDRATFFLLPIFLIYLMREASQLRRNLIGRLRGQLRLELANRRLHRSRQELVEQTARTVHASRLASLGEMAGGIAHEVNNPLAIIDLSLESFKITHARLYGPLDPQAAAILERGQKAIRRISAIVKGLKNFSRAGEHDPLETVSVGQVVEDTLGLCAEKMKAHAVKLRVEGDLSFSLHCRPVEIAQILINLINNAYDVVRELPSDGREIVLQAKREGGKAWLSVTNAGPLIPREVAEKLFQPFFTTKAPGEGTGLGLSVSLAIAKKHGGDLFLKEGGSRTTFVLELPQLLKSEAEPR